MIHALRIPEGQDPEVIADQRWGTAAIEEALSTSSYVWRRLAWQPNEPRFLVLSGRDGEGPRNITALTLAGEHYGWLYKQGPLLITAHTRTGRPTSLTVEEILLIGTRLLVGEATQAALAAP